MDGVTSNHVHNHDCHTRADDKCENVHNKFGYGTEIREKEFYHLRRGSTFLNQGSYGVIPMTVKNMQRRYMDEKDENPDHWFRRRCVELVQKARKTLSEFVNCDFDDLVFVQNATTGISCIFMSVPLKKTESILATDQTFTACKYICQRFAALKDSKVQMLKIDFPIYSEDEYVKSYDDYLTNNPDVKIAIIDHISSGSAVRHPIKKIAQVCRKHNVLSLIDGAHAPGHVPIDIKDIDPDFYVGDMHKWCFTPQGCAFMYVKKKHQSWVKPLVTSLRYQLGMTEEFYSQGTRDDTTYLAAAEAVRFYKTIGGLENIISYNSMLVDKVTDRMVSAWGTEKLQIPKSMQAPCMRLVLLPYITGYEATRAGGLRMMDRIYFEHDINVFVSDCNGRLYLRVSAHVYNTFSDYMEIIQVIKNMADIQPCQ